MIVYICDHCGKEIPNPDAAPRQDNNIFCSNVCRSQFTLQSEPVPGHKKQTPPAPKTNAQPVFATADISPQPPKKRKSSLALWLPIIISGLIVLAFHLPEYFMKKKVDEEMENLRVPGKFDEPLGIELGEPSDNPYIDQTLGFSITFPKGWIVKDALTDASIAKKAVYTNPVGRRATIIVYAWEVAPEFDWVGLTSQSLFKQSYGQVAEYIDGGETMIDGYKALWMKLKFTEYPVESYSITYAVLRDSTLFSIFGQTLIGDYQWFQENEGILIKSINSFRFL